MTTRFGPTLISGKTVFGVNNLGVLGSEVPSTGTHGPSAIYSELTLPGDNSTEVRFLITSTPGGSTVVMDEDGGFTASGLTDGTYSLVGNFYKRGVLQGSVSHTFTIGAVSTPAGVARIAIRGTFLPPKIVELHRNLGITATGQLVVILS